MTTSSTDTARPTRWLTRCCARWPRPAEAGRITPLTVAGTPLGIQVDHDHCAGDRLWLFGPITEGNSYYNHYVPTPGDRSRAAIDADALARRLLDLIPHDLSPAEEGLHAAAH